MSFQEAKEQYEKALKRGKKEYKEAIHQGRYPYPQVLDEILNLSMAAGQVDLGVMEVPSYLVTGIKTAGRKTSFSTGFMPLLPWQSEFGSKWIMLCQAHLGEEGIRDPILCYEYLGRFYVQEGNKRVSVLKSFDAATIPAHVIRVVPMYSEDPTIRSYYEFMEFYRLSHIYRVKIHQPGGYAKFLAALGMEQDHIWTAEERTRFISCYDRFREAFHRHGGDRLPVTTAEALLVWLGVYPFTDLWEKTAPELEKTMAAVWPDVKLQMEEEPIAISTEPAEPEHKVFQSLMLDTRPAHLDVAFLYSSTVENSAWAKAHDLGRQYLEEVMGSRITVRTYDGIHGSEDAEEVMEQAVTDGAQVIFATSPPMIGACRKIAARYPQVKVLNCALSMPYAGVRTYYGRIYEAKFLTGALAGAMTRTNKIGYVANYPIFGVPAGINAFALGAKMTNPRVEVKLRWSCLPREGALFAGEDVDVISNREGVGQEKSHLAWEWGTYLIEKGGLHIPLGTPLWDWGRFYEKVVSSILDGGWDALSGRDGQRAVNYWWGLGTGVIDVKLSDRLPEGVARLVEILKKGVANGTVSPFATILKDQKGVLRNDGSRNLTPEEILHMDWLCQGVEGAIPQFDELLPMSQNLVRLLGIYRDEIPPEKEWLL